MGRDNGYKGIVMAVASSGGSILDGVAGMLDDLEALYKDVHRHPELSMQEQRTAGAGGGAAAGGRVRGDDGRRGDRRRRAARERRRADRDVRADMDALPVQEQTGLPYASTVTATDATGDGR